MYIVKRYMYYAVGRDFALSVSFVLECFDGSEVTTREGSELVVQKENCVVEEIKEVDLRSHKPSVSLLTRSVSILQKACASSLTRSVRTLTQAFRNYLRKAFSKSYTKDNKNCLHNF